MNPEITAEQISQCCTVGAQFTNVKITDEPKKQIRAESVGEEQGCMRERRSWTLLLVVRKLLNSNFRYVKVILMSATINCVEFAEYFGSPVDTPRPDEPRITVDMNNVAVSLIQSFDEKEGKEQSRPELDGSTSLPERGSVLVFLPGLAEIQYMQEALSKLVRKRLQVYPLHSTVTLEEQNGVFLEPVPGYRKRLYLNGWIQQVRGKFSRTVTREVFPQSRKNT